MFGIPHDKWGETPVAAVVLRAGQAVAADELKAMDQRAGGGEVPAPGPRAAVRRVPAQRRGKDAEARAARAVLGRSRARHLSEFAAVQRPALWRPLPPACRIGGRSENDAQAKRSASTPEESHGHPQRSRPGRDPGMDRFAARGAAAPGRRARALAARPAGRGGAEDRHDAGFLRDDPLPQHHPAGAGGKIARQPRARAQDPRGDPLERGGDHPAREQGILGARRPHRELPVLGAALRHRLRPLLARADGRTTAATSSTCRATSRRASTRAPSSRGASPRSSSSTTGRRARARASRRIRTRG